MGAGAPPAPAGGRLGAVRHPHRLQPGKRPGRGDPAKLEELQELFIQEAVKYRVLPTDDRSIERLNPATAGRPDPMGDRTSLTLSQGMAGMSENVFINVKNRSFSITADLEIPPDGANGVVLAQAGRFGGWSLYLKEGRPTFCYNYLGLERYTVAAAQALPPGRASVRMNFDYDGGGIAKGGTATLLVDGRPVASGRVERTQPITFSADETAGVGVDDATPVTTDYPERDDAFTGTVVKVVVEVKPIGAAVKAEADAAQHETGVKRALADEGRPGPAPRPGSGRRASTGGEGDGRMSASERSHRMTTRALSLTLLATLVLATAAAAASVELYSVQFAEKRTVDLGMKRTAAAPAAGLTAEVRYENGQAAVTLEYTAMKPAVLFAGDVTCYVVWAVTRDGAAENLGELVVREDRGEVEMRTGQKAFALMVTAEPYSLVPRPSEMVMWTSTESTDRRAPSSQFTYAAFDPAPAHGLDSISTVAYDSTVPPELLQARKAHELAQRLGAAELADTFFSDATVSLNQANNFAQSNPRSKNTFDFSRRSIQASNEAIRQTTRILAERKAAAEAAARKAELDRLAADASQAQADADAAAKEAERQRAHATQALAELDRQRAEMTASLAAMREERAALTADMERIRQEKLGLSNRLQDALGKVASTQSSARGYIVNLPDILFDVNQATLKPEAKIAIAKLAGILLVMPDLNLRVEGHTDSTGTAEHNQKLSEERARAVVAFVTEQGVEASRLTSFGYGPTRPLADNDSAEGRKKNRRVEIVVGEGTIQEAAAPATP